MVARLLRLHGGIKPFRHGVVALGQHVKLGAAHFFVNTCGSVAITKVGHGAHNQADGTAHAVEHDVQEAIDQQNNNQAPANNQLPVPTDVFSCAGFACNQEFLFGLPDFVRFLGDNGHGHTALTNNNPRPRLIKLALTCEGDLSGQGVNPLIGGNLQALRPLVLYGAVLNQLLQKVDLGYGGGNPVVKILGKGWVGGQQITAFLGLCFAQVGQGFRDDFGYFLFMGIPFKACNHAVGSRQEQA